MAYSWEEVKQAVERVEDARLEQRIAKAEVDEGYITPSVYVVQRSQSYLEILGALVVGAHVAIMSLMLNFLFWTWLLHVNFEP